MQVPAGGKVKVEVGGEIRLGSEIRFKLTRPEAPGAQNDAKQNPQEAPPAPALGTPPASAPPPRRTPKKTRIIE